MVSSWICLALLAVTPPAPAVNSAPQLTAEQMIGRVAAQDKILVERRKSFDYDIAITREKFDSDRKITETIHDKTSVVGNHAPGYGTRTDPQNPQAEAQKTSREEPFELLKIIDHYNYKLEGEETVDGVACYKIAFTPKPDQPYDNREEKVLNNVSGHIWASKADFSLVKNEGALMSPVSVAWIFATLREMEFHFDAMQMPNGDYGPGHLQYRYLVTMPFFQLSERDTRVASNYRYVGPPVKGN